MSILSFLAFQCHSQKLKIDECSDRITKAAISIIDPEIVDDPAYVSIDYPNGDVDAKKGFCTDVVIRAYRKMGIDLQKLVHEDMKASVQVKWQREKIILKSFTTLAMDKLLKMY